MTKERRLKKEAMEACGFRGHEMERFTKLEKGKFISRCIYCEKEVIITLKPLPNEIDIGGEAVALNCI
jgi:hypothetical protein